MQFLKCLGDIRNLQNTKIARPYIVSIFVSLFSSLIFADSCGGVTHSNISINPMGDYGLVPAQFVAVCQVKTAGINNNFMSENLNLTKDALWVLGGRVEIGKDIFGGAQTPLMDLSSPDVAILTIEAGTTVVGDFNANNPPSNLDSLVIHRGSQLYVNGAEAEPVHFTSIQALTNQTVASGQWGGITINGYARINSCSTGALVDDCESTALFGLGQYGGINNDISSGALHYLIIENAGFAAQGLSFDGLSLNAVGSSTEISNLQVANSNGIGLRLNGGEVNASYLVLNKNQGTIEWNHGWRGSLQYLIIQQDSLSFPVIHGSNHPEEFSAVPQSLAVIANATIISDNQSQIISLDKGTAVDIVSGVISDSSGTCFTHSNVNQNDLQINFTRVNCASIGASSIEEWFDNGTYNSESNVDLNGYINGELLNGALTIGIPTLPNIKPENFIGAIDYCKNDWAASWAVSLPLVNPDSCVEEVFNVPLFSTVGATTFYALLMGVGYKARH